MENVRSIESKPRLIFRNLVSLFLSYVVKEACVYVIRTREKDNLGQLFYYSIRYIIFSRYIAPI